MEIAPALLTVRACACAFPARAAGFKKPVKDANLELKVYDMEQMSCLFSDIGECVQHVHVQS